MNTTICRKPKSDDALIREGAKAAIVAVRRIEAICERDNVFMEGTIEQNCDSDNRSREAAVGAVMQAIGDLPPRQRGFVMAMAECIDYFMRYGEPNLEIWTPDASMTATQLKAHRADEIAALM